jgi:hypothetical protein
MKKTYLGLIYKSFLKEDAAKYLYEHEGLLVRQAAAFARCRRTNRGSRSTIV